MRPHRTASTASTASTAGPARTATCLGPRLSASALAGSAVLLSASSLLQPTLTGGAAQKLAAIDADPVRTGLAAVLFAVGQLPFIFAVLAVAALVRPRHRRTAAVGAALGVVGGFGHALFGGVSLTYLVMAGDQGNRAVHAQLIERVESSPVMLTSVAGLAGTVLGLLALSVGVFRSGVGPRWVGPALWAFLLVEFAGTAVSTVASVVSAALLLVTFGALARTVVRQTTRQPPATGPSDGQPTDGPLPDGRPTDGRSRPGGVAARV